MPWGVVVCAGVALARGSDDATPAGEAERTACEGCGAPLELSHPVCGHCRRPRKGAEPSHGYSYKGADRWPTHDEPMALPPAPAASYYAPAPAAYEPSSAPAPAYDFSAPVSDFSSGGGGDFSGGGATGEF